jgi:hypothetical protein
MPSKIIPFYVRCVLDWHAFFRSQWTLSSTAHYMSFLRKQESMAPTDRTATKTS